ncbi:MAG TPA: EthD family reductase [Acetobacteraceae bacterium]
MIVVFSLMRRRADVTAETFRQHWLDPHGPLVCKFPRLRRYSQNHVTALRTIASALPPALRVDGFAELAYDNDTDQEVATGSPEMAACDRDSPLFIGSVLRVVTQDRPIRPQPPWAAGAAKQITVFTGEPNEAEAALSRFRDAVTRTAGVTGHIENIALRQRGARSEVPVLDVPVAAIVEVWFADQAAMRRAAADLDKEAGVQAATCAVTEHRFI